MRQGVSVSRLGAPPDRAPAKARPDPEVARWIRRTLADQPPRARSLIVTVWGDALAPHGGEVWLATIAVAVAVMAAAQVVVLILAGRALSRATASLAELRRDIQPVIDRVHEVSVEAARAAALATSQMERVDQMLASTAVRLDQTLTVVQGAVVEPMRQGAAVVAAFRAALAVFRGLGDRHRSPREEDEALFVG